MPGSFGYTGQRSDALTGLNYDGARYYDPLAAQFISADTILPGNGYDPWGLSRYAYVEGNPLIRTDPTGHDGGWLGGIASAVSSTVSTVASAVVSAAPTIASAAWTALDYTTSIPSMIGDMQTIFSGNSSFLDKVMAVGDIALNVTMDVTMLVGVGEGMRAAYIGAKVAGHVIMDAAGHLLAHAGEDAVEHVAEHEIEDEAVHAAEHVVEDCLSFAAATLVAIPGGGETPISHLKAGDRVTAYDPTTGKASTQTVQATHITHDTDLLDVTLRITKVTPATKASAAQHAARSDRSQGTATTATTTTATTTTRTEVVHTTANHPWLTADHGWLPTSFMRIGESVQTLDGVSGASGDVTATVVAIRVVPGAAPMYDLTVSNLHDFAVGAGEFVVHNGNFCKFGSDNDAIDYEDIIHKHGMNGREGKSLFNLSDDDIKMVVKRAWENRTPFKRAIIDSNTGYYMRHWLGEAIDRYGRNWVVEGVYNQDLRRVVGAWPRFDRMF